MHLYGLPCVLAVVSVQGPLLRLGIARLAAVDVVIPTASQLSWFLACCAVIEEIFNLSARVIDALFVAFCLRAAESLALATSNPKRGLAGGYLVAGNCDSCVISQ